MDKNTVMSTPEHPGKELLRILDQQAMTQAELAIRTGVTPKHISTIISGKQGISASFAKKLAYVLGETSEFWVKRQAAYADAIAAIEEQNGIREEEVSVLKRIKEAVDYLKDMKLLSNDLAEPNLILELRKIMRVSNLLAIPSIPFCAAYRAKAGKKAALDLYVVYAWQRICEILAKPEEITSPLRKDALRSRLPDIKALMFEPEPNDMRYKLRQMLAEYGIAFAIVRNFVGAPVQGLIKTLDDGKAILCLTLRGQRADAFWFTLFHEIGHLLSGDLGLNFVDFTGKGDLEAQADEFASAVLLNPTDYENFVIERDFSDSSIRSFAETQAVKPGIVVGRLQNDGIIGWNEKQNLLAKYRWA